jgi:hypothetical protein
MKFLPLLIISLVMVGFALAAFGISLLFRRKESLQAGSCGNISADEKKNSGCACGRGHNCAIE